jgi:hypothetical protein
MGAFKSVALVVLVLLAVVLWSKGPSSVTGVKPHHTAVPSPVSTSTSAPLISVTTVKP